MVTGRWTLDGVTIVLRGALPSDKTAKTFRATARLARMLLDPIPPGEKLDISEEEQVEIGGSGAITGKQLAAALELAANDIDVKLTQTTPTSEELQRCAETSLDDMLDKLDSVHPDQFSNYLASRSEFGIVRGVFPAALNDFEVTPAMLRPNYHPPRGAEETIMASAKKELFKEGHYESGDKMVYFHSGQLDKFTAIRAVEGIALVRGGQVVAHVISGFLTE